MNLRIPKLAFLCAGQLLIVLTVFSQSLRAQEVDPALEVNGERIDLSATDTGVESELNTLFSQLSHARTQEDAKLVENAIWERWNRSGSISVDLLLSRGLEALSKGEYDRSLSFLDEVVDLAPGYPEGWNKRATVHFLREDYENALNDIQTTLALEPRHFGAIGGLALMLEDLGDKEGALDAYRRVLAVYPWLEGAVEAESRLTVEVEGRGI
jgi:tetratricopeptide (TPR) repeat protein